LPEYFGEAPLRDLGLVCSEGRHTIPLHDNDPVGVLAVTTNYYEFIPMDEAASSRRATLEAHQLSEGCDYSLVMTTSAGYFRFEIGDVVRCRGYAGEAPLLEFVQKLGACADLEGEKLTENQIVQAVGQAAAEQNIRLGCFTAVPCRPTADRPCYVLLVEHGNIPTANRATRFLEAVDRNLASGNFLYAGNRRALVLGPPRLWRLSDGTWNHYQESVSALRGTGDVQYKHRALVADASLLKRLKPVDIIEIARQETRAAA
jgi:hypothetical protein